MLASPPRLPRTLKRPLVVAGSLFALVLALRGWLQWVGPLPGDRYALVHYTASHPGLPGWIIDIYVTLARPWACAVVLIIGLWVLYREAGSRVAVGLLLSELVIIWNAVLKALFGATPLFAGVHASGVNYPSGHVSYAVGVFGYLTWVGARRRWRVLVAVSVIVILGMGPERVLSGAHLVSDVAGGYLLALGWLVLIVGWVTLEPGVLNRGAQRRAPTT